MLTVHTEDGRTARIDLEKAEQAEEWLSRLKDPEFQKQITALTIAFRGVQYSLVRPRGFSQSFFLAELVQSNGGRVKGGERITVFSDDVRLSVMAHREQRAARVAIVKTGKRRFNPLLR
ncbi:hypothetical protein LCGC14_0874890 [marine sediment metagenome]|uniref:Uncharacterized protein n=1 Tax=marine sediment metagenome TaxID=412755 RepID=A0A0F9RN96_9ZZZZ